jgi:dTDP-4-dehydrorhamnose reductase
LAQGTIAITERGATGIFHLSGPETHSIWDLAVQIADFWRLDKSLMKPVTSAELNQPAKRPPVTGFILDKAIKQLDYHPRSFAQGLTVVDQQLKNI